MTTGTESSLFDRVRIRGDPVANPDSVVSTQPPQEGDRTWFLGGALTTPEDSLMIDLVFELGGC